MTAKSANFGTMTLASPPPLTTPQEQAAARAVRRHCGDDADLVLSMLFDPISVGQPLPEAARTNPGAQLDAALESTRMQAYRQGLTDMELGDA